VAQQYDDELLPYDGEITSDDQYTLIPAGEYAFRVEKFERGIYQPGESSKIPSCKKVAATLEILDSSGLPIGQITNNFYLLKRLEGLIGSFFAATGQKRKGEPFRMDWPGSVGKTGRCTVKTAKSSNGNDMNNIGRFIPKWDAQPGGAGAPPEPGKPGGFTPGDF
jgi:hypothetical protein